MSEGNSTAFTMIVALAIIAFVLIMAVT